jgi:ATP-dependent Clp protease protease subunit
MQKNKQRLNKLLAQNTGRTIEEIERDTDRDNFMSAEEAKAYGLIDAVIFSRDLNKVKF